MSTPTFSLDDDGVHVWWQHDCTDPIKALHGSRLRTDFMLPQGHGTFWTVVQREPLTLTPSILCTGCGCHGFITNGEWVPA